LNVKAVNTPYKNMFSLMSTFLFVSELRSKIEKPMSKFVMSTITADTGNESSSTACCHSGLGCRGSGSL